MDGKLQFKEWARKKPVSITEAGRLLTTAELEADAALRIGSLHTLPADLQVTLAVERYALEPDFKLGIIGRGILTRDEIVTHIKDRTPFGELAVRAEMHYCNQLISMLAGAEIPSWPEPKRPAAQEWPDFKQAARTVLLRVKNEALFCENTTDPITTPIANRRMATVIQLFRELGYLVVVLEGADDVRANFALQAKRPLTVYIGGVGHGNQTTFTGYQNQPILQVGHYDPSEVAGKSIHFLSCETGAQLGPDTVAKGARSYFGYTEDFYLTWDDSVTPVNEFNLFVDTDAIYDTFMAYGANAQTSYNATILAFNAAIAQVPGTAAATWLTWDRDHAKLFGDPAAVIAPYRYVRITFPVTELERETALVAAGELVD